MHADMNFEPTLEHARRRDADDPLREFRTRFALPLDERCEPMLYLCGHSLGLMPLAARERVLEELEDWACLGVRGHEEGRRPWIPYHENMTAGLQHLTGALATEVVAMNSLTVNLHLMLASFYRPSGERCKIVIEAGAFSSDRHAVAAHIHWHGLDPERDLVEIAPADGEDLIPETTVEAYLAEHGREVALVLWPGIQFRTGQAFDIARIARAAHQAGCIAGFDLAHSIGNTPLALHDAEADFAVWCSYKYLNSGPGAIGGCFIHEKHATSDALRLAGWWGHDPSTRFRMEPGFQPAAGAAGWQVSNPPILAAAPLIASLELFQAARIERLRAKSIALNAFMELLLEPLSADVQIVTPRNAEARGCQISLRIVGAGRGRAVFEWLGKHGVVCDWREPDIIRVAAAPLYNQFQDVYRFSELLAQALKEVR